MKTIIGWIVQFLVVAALGFGVFLFLKQTGGETQSAIGAGRIEEATLNLPVINLTPQTVTPEYVSLAKVEEWQSSTLASQATGRVVSVCACFEEGQLVSQGTRLIQIDTASYEREIVDREKDLSNARADLVVAEVETEQARENYARLNLGEPNDIVLKIPELTAATLAVESADAALTIARKGLDETTVVAPFSGIITAAAVNQGDLVSNGANLGTIVGTNTFKVRFPILENQLSLARIGAEISVETTTDPMIRKTAIIKAIDIDIDQSTRLNSVIVAVQEPLEGEVLRLGRFVNGTFSSPPITNVFAIPLIALNNQTQFYEIGNDGRLMAVDTTPVYRDFRSIYVDAGDRDKVQIVSGNVLGLRTGMLVQGYEQ